MSRRKKRPGGRNSDPPIARTAAPPRKRPWLLAVTALLQAGWLAFLIATALAAR